MKSLFLFLLLPAFAWAQTPKDFTVSGKLNTAQPADWVYLSYRTADNTVTDSLQPKDGQFTYKGQIAEPTLASLRVKHPAVDGAAKGKMEAVQIFLMPGKSNFTATDSLKNYRVTGAATDANKDYTALMAKEKPYAAWLNVLYSDWSRYGAEKNKEAQKGVENRIDSLETVVREDVYKNFVTTHPKSPVALYALKQYAGYDINADKVQSLFASLPKSTQQWPSAKNFNELIAIAKKTGVGQYAMNFTQNDTLGNPVSLASFKGKYVLVDFWASWCGPCRAENPNVVKVFRKYNGKGFTILSVSLDRPNAKEKWLKAIHDDSLTWNHVSDLKYWDNEVAKQYGIKAIPANLLLDPQGKIIAKNLRGEDLEAKLNEVFGGVPTAQKTF